MRWGRNVSEGKQIKVLVLQRWGYVHRNGNLKASLLELLSEKSLDFRTKQKELHGYSQRNTLSTILEALLNYRNKIPTKHPGSQMSSWGIGRIHSKISISLLEVDKITRYSFKNCSWESFIFPPTLEKNSINVKGWQITQENQRWPFLLL